MKKLFVFLLLICGGTVLSAQKYDIAAGVKLSKGLGISGIYRYHDNLTAEALAFAGIGGNTDLVALTHYHGRIVYSRRFNWFAGAGLHFGQRKDIGGVSGAALNVGLEMTINRYNLSWDNLLLHNLNADAKTFELGTGLTLRYVIKPRKRNNPLKILKDGRYKRTKRRKT